MELSIYELYDLADEVKKRTGGDPLGMLAFANRTDSLYNLLASVGLESLMPGGLGNPFGPKKIAVLGASLVSVDKLLSIAKAAGASEEDIEFQLDYSKLKNYDFGKLRNKESYKAVMFGPGPHSTPGKGNSSSALIEMKSHPEIYPPVVEIRDKGGELKITAKSFERAIAAALSA